ncbi:Autoinducer 2 import system permease protein LsrD [bacterium HR17]|uniref:Autoinducer 2 import system permease protein LsrD n=1 Tax=Candidatus Fervidibacter japonicus TaxID=2035412 RepID=A0A2H5X8V2_9BACT|nr:Autoinducer 2 import system permease protein LsrD [bacterium HR17]
MARWALLLLIWLVAISAFGIRTPEFVRPTNLLEMTRQFTEVAVMALPMTALLIAGGIDLSVASVLAMATVIVGWSYRAGVPLTIGVPLALLGGALMGAVNGACIAYLRLPPIIVTLATMALFRGLAMGVTGGGKVSGFPRAFLAIGQDQWLGIVPVQLPLLLTLAALTWFVLHQTVWGRHIYAVGAGEEAARFSGVPVEATKLGLYVASGLFAALAGVLYVARFNTAKADAYLGAELDVITAVLLGGTPLTGGEGSLTGTLLALLLLCTLRRGLDMAQIGTEQQAILTGALLILAVALGQKRR